ncbi:MAG: hypothetical protein QM770_20495 [Tepidisphaeraceae bacterium]
MAANAFDGKHSFVAIPVRRGKPHASLASTAVVYLLIVAGLAMVGAAVLAPLREESRSLAHDAFALQREVDQVNRQMQINRDFVAAVPTDPQLATRLAMRQHTDVGHTDTKSIALRGATTKPFAQSPFALTSLPPPEPLPAYSSDVPAALRSWLLDANRRSLVLGLGVFCVAAGLILGAMPTRSKQATV